LFYYLPDESEESISRKAGLPEEGYILEVAGEKVIDKDGLERVLNENENKTIDVKVVNNKLEENTFQVALGSKAKDGKVKMGIYVVTKSGVDAVEAPVFYLVNYNSNKITSGITHTYNITVYQTIGLGKVIQKAFQGDRKQLTDSLATPIKVGEVVYDLVSIGDFKNIINLAGLISATLAFMNLLPIPLIDGGQFWMLFIEKLLGKPLPEKLQDILGKVGLGCIMLLGVVLIFKDFWQVILSRIF
jgi:regulator of sigma E protease